MIALTPWVVALVTISIWPGDAVLRRRSEELQRRRILQFLRRLLGAFVRLVERQNPQELRQQHHADVLARDVAIALGAIAATRGSSANNAATAAAPIRYFFIVLSLSICFVCPDIDSDTTPIISEDRLSRSFAYSP